MDGRQKAMGLFMEVIVAFSNGSTNGATYGYVHWFISWCIMASVGITHKMSRLFVSVLPSSCFGFVGPWSTNLESGILFDCGSLCGQFPYAQQLLIWSTRFWPTCDWYGPSDGRKARYGDLVGLYKALEPRYRVFIVFIFSLVVENKCNNCKVLDNQKIYIENEKYLVDKMSQRMVLACKIVCPVGSYNCDKWIALPTLWAKRALGALMTASFAARACWSSFPWALRRNSSIFERRTFASWNMVFDDIRSSPIRLVLLLTEDSAFAE